MNETIRRQMLRRCEEVDRLQAAYLITHPDSPRYCYTCQVWLDNVQAEGGHHGHSIH